MIVGIVSVLVLVLAARQVVYRLSAVAKSFAISETVIAMTIISIGTSLPELALHVVGSLRIVSGTVSLEDARLISATVLGSNIGSDVVQQTLVLGVVIMTASLIRGSFGFRFTRKFLLRYYAPMIGTTLLTLLLSLDHHLSRLDGFILFGSFLAYLSYLFFKRDEILARQGNADPSEKPVFDLTLGIAFMLAVVFSADVFLEVIKATIQATGLSGSLIGVITVGILSALPEMVTAISGLRQGAEGISLGTLIGSNITNPLLAIGLGALISTYSVPLPLIYWDLPMETVTAAVLLAYLFLRSGLGRLLSYPVAKIGLTDLAKRLKEAENRVLTIPGAFFLTAMYFGYLYVRMVYFSVDYIVH